MVLPMPTREIILPEKEGLKFLHDQGIVSALLHVTETGLEKSILDATRQIRKLFFDSGFHDYEKQGQGQDNKLIVSGKFISHEIIQQTKVSLYRPITKVGDPRIWPTGLKNHATCGDVIAIFILGKECCFTNLTRLYPKNKKNTFENSLLQSLLTGNSLLHNPAANELLKNLKQLASIGPIKAICKGPTAIGRSLENALGIEMNSSQLPDFKGIEIKAFRELINNSKGTRVTLFACVPDWNLSFLKGSKGILEAFGYERGKDFKLYCTVGLGKPNSQGLVLALDDAKGWLRENSTSKQFPQVAVWPLEKLEDKLCSKHKETFWIKATSFQSHGSEYFKILSATHTKGPNVFQLERLLLRNEITVDHLIKKNIAGIVKEKGPLFKIQRKFIPDLFLGKPVVHSFES